VSGSWICGQVTGKENTTSTTSTTEPTSTQQKPIIIIHGQSLGTLPPRDPTTTPSNQPLCPVAIEGTPGYDYGTRLYVAFGGVAAGRYRPSLNELDCLGLIVTKFTTTEVDLQIGGFYTQTYPKFALTAGEVVQLQVNNASTTVHVKYGATVTS